MQPLTRLVVAIAGWFRRDQQAAIVYLLEENGVLYSRSGVTAYHNLAAMELTGIPGAKLYLGSWSEWCADAARPTETGDEAS